MSDQHPQGPSVPDDDRGLDDWLRAHRDATTDTLTADGPAQVWDPRTGSWVDPGSASQAAERSGERRRAPWLRPAIAGGVVGAIVAALVAVPVARWAAPDADPSSSGPTNVQQNVAERLPAGKVSGTGIIEIASRARPWVVNINVGTNQSTLFGDVRVSGTGSGVILRSDGHIITNAHVVEGARSIQVTLASGDELPAKLIGSDPETDVAVIKVEQNGLPSAVIGSVKDLEVGATAVAIGSPLGLEQSVTAGIISALGRRVDREDQTPLFDMIQTDAAVTQGNSGGALIDGTGAVVGINSAIAASPVVGAEGVAFAIPIDVAVAVAEELVNSGRATHPWLGITGGNITEEAADKFGVKEGAFIQDITDGGPADKAGLRPNDIVTKFAGETIESMDDLIVAIRNHRVGESVQVEVQRDGSAVTLTAILGDKPSQ